jgi:hypothetical protein
MARSPGFLSRLRHGVVRRSGLLLAASFVASGGALAIGACSSSSTVEGDTPDATSESTTPDAARDGTIPKTDGGQDGGGNCTVVKGACDLVLQDCPDKTGQKQECVVDNSNKTVCQPVQASQQLPIGRACCPSTTSNPCLPGLQCIGNDCSDGGPQTGRCSPVCCKGDDKACGKSDPEGLSGACSLSIVDSTQSELYRVCLYSTQCAPFKTQPCKTGEICIVEDKVGTASCVNSNGKTNRQSCQAANDCADGLICLGAGDAGVCHTVCLLFGTTNPFDAAVQEGGPGLGGCPSGEACNVHITSLPDWFGACVLPDGG